MKTGQKGRLEQDKCAGQLPIKKVNDIILALTF